MPFPSPRLFRFPLLLALVAALMSAAIARAGDAADAPAILHILGYIGVDYPSTVVNGKVHDQGEYAEQREFSARVRTLIDGLPASIEKESLRKKAAQLVAQIDARDSGEKVSQLTEGMRDLLVQAYRVPVTPRKPVDLAQGARLYIQHCESCHGREGLGDGAAARGLTPPPANFHDTARQSQRSVYALYNAISLGVTGTGMQGFAQTLKDDERWSLAFHVANFLADDKARSAGAALWKQDEYRKHFATLAAVTNLSPKQAETVMGRQGVDALAWLRANPIVFDRKESPLAFSARMLDESLEQYRAGKVDQAYATAVTAYIEGFELAETGITAVKPSLKQDIEREMYAFRNSIRARAPLVEVDAVRAKIGTLLDEAREILDNASLSPAVAYTSSLVILLREGVEALLLLAVVVAFLVKTGRRHELKYIHMGWIAALLLGVATWFVAAYVVDISGASREMTEGVTALLAAAILLYVGFWLHNKLQAERWKDFIESKVKNSINEGTLWSIALVAFIAVYREVFETVLFYQTLWVQAGENGQHMVVMGFLSASALLVVIAWLIFRFSVRLPLRLFFAINSVLLYVLAVVFAGKGIAALQEAGKLPVSPIDIPTVNVLGIFPNLQSTGLQAALILAALAFVVLNRRKAG